MTQRDTRIVQIEIAYVPKRGKDQAVRDALTDAIDQVFLEQFGDLVDGASSTFRFMRLAD